MAELERQRGILLFVPQSFHWDLILLLEHVISAMCPFLATPNIDLRISFTQLLLTVRSVVE